jgi:2-dehydro-3-deoxyphosphogluconate aldolase / (4S)-4-hydroxy-2-oxoglutarate aldolase
VSRNQTLFETVGSTPVIPVIVIDEAETAVPLARALVDGGLTVLEITLRTRAALEAVRAIRAEVPEAIVGVGSVLEPAQLATSLQAGATFAVSPGATASLLDAARDSALAWLPAAQSVSEVLRLREAGYHFQKFFPAEPSGGAAFIRAIGGPVADVSFCPTGGIDQARAGGYLELPNVRCVGGSWMCAPALVRERHWSEVTARARSARALRGA